MAEGGDYRQKAAETKRQRTREALLDGARQLFEERGWHEIRMEDIARRAGVSPATAYQYFKNKRAIIGPAYEPYYTELRAELTSDLDEMPALSALERLVTSLSTLARKRPMFTINIMTATREQTLLGLARSDGEPDILGFVPFSSLLIDCLARAQSQGEISPDLNVTSVGSYHTNALLLRLFFDADESSEDTAALVMSQLGPVL